MLLSRSLRTDPYPMCASRRVGAPVRVRVCPPRRGYLHPAGPADIDRVLAFVGAAAVYGLRGIELRQQPAGNAGPAVAALRVPGLVLLFEQPTPPWDLSGQLTDAAVARLRRAGARVAIGRAG